MTREDTLARFETQSPDPEELKVIQQVRDGFRLLAQLILDSTYTGREQSLALTNLEESMMWTNKSIALGGSPLVDA